MNFKNKVVLITGASSGIGAAIAIKFSEEGANVAMVGRNIEKLTNVAEKCKDNLVIVADISKEEDCKRIVDETVSTFGRIDVLVNSAGAFKSNSIKADNSLTIFDEVMATNLRSVVCLTHLTAKHLIQTKGNIVNISAIGSTRVMVNNYSHNAFKAALDHFTRTVALELSNDGVRVNVICPGPTRTDILKNFGYTKVEEDVIWEKLSNMTALKRISEPEEIADLVMFMASDKAKGITGSSIISDNGCLLTGGLML